MGTDGQLVGATASGSAVWLEGFDTDTLLGYIPGTTRVDVFKAILHADSGAYEVYLYDGITVTGGVLNFATTITDGDGDTALWGPCL